MEITDISSYGFDSVAGTRRTLQPKTTKENFLNELKKEKKSIGNNPFWMLNNWEFRALIRAGRRTRESIIALCIAQQELEESREGGKGTPTGSGSFPDLGRQG